MSWVLRGLLLLAAVMPVFARTLFHPVWWQIFIAAAIGSALGQLAVRFTRGRRIAQGAVIAVALAVIGGSAVWTFRRGATGTARNSYLVLRSPSLTWQDVDEIRTLPSVHLVAPYLRKSMQTSNEDANWNTSVVGTTKELFELMNLGLARGTGFVPDAGKIVVLGDTVVKQLYGAKNPVGQTILIGAQPYKVAGVLAHRGETPEGQDLDDIILVPVDIYEEKIERGMARHVDGSILIAPVLHGDTLHLEADVRSLLRERHHRPAASDDNDDVTTRTITP